MSVKWPARLSLARLPTPFSLLERLSHYLGGPRIWIKRDDLTGSVLSGNKVRKLEFTLAHAIRAGHDLFITCGGLQSNHCRATAFAGAQLGIPVHLVLRGHDQALDGNYLLDHLAGACTSCYDPSEYQARLTELLEEHRQYYQQQGYNPYIIPTGASDGVGVWGYVAAVEELKKDFEEHDLAPEFIICATGSGGTQAGLTLGVDYFGLVSQVLGIAVCDSEAYFQDKVARDIEDFWREYAGNFSRQYSPSFKIATNASHIGEGYAKASDDVFQAITMVAKMEGILLDPVYTGKAFQGLIVDIQRGLYKNAKDIVFIHTGGGFGIFPYRNSLSQLFSHSPLGLKKQ